MAQYKVPQDVEADDKLLGPFTFRQFVYLMIMGGFVGLAFALFQIFPLLALLAVPFVIFFAVLALPLRKDQPMETYLAAVVSFHLKPNKRFWNPGQRESTVEITAPKKVEQPRARDISEEEAGNRLSFLANVIDTEGYAVRGDLNNAPLHAQILEEADATPDVLDASASPVINQMLAKQQDTRHQELVNQMREAINRVESSNAGVPTNYTGGGQVINPISTAQVVNPAAMPSSQPVMQASQPMMQPGTTMQAGNIAGYGMGPQAMTSPNVAPSPAVMAGLQNLANNTEYSVETISKEAARIEKQGNNEVTVSLR